MKLKLSNYLTIVQKGDERLLAQGILARTVVIKKKLFDEVVKNLDKTGSAKIEKTKMRLMEFLMVLPDEVDERKFAEAVFEGESAKRSRGCSLILVLTQRCNFACRYCYENPRKIDMDKRVAAKALNWLFRKARKVDPKIMLVSFYGGEPLMNFNTLEYAVKKVRTFCKKHGIKPQFSIISNGSLFTQRISDLFSSERDLCNIQITLDGAKEMHDQRRPFKGGKGSYDTIMQRLPLMFKASRMVTVRINIDVQNRDGVPGLLRDLNKIKKRNLEIYLGHVTSTYGKGMSWNRSMDFNDFDQIKKAYYDEAGELGLKIKRDEEKLLDRVPVCCVASYADPYAIAPDGDMYCCSLVVGKKSLAVGNIFTGYDSRKAKKWIDYNVINNEKCKSCKHIFFCGGACLARAMRGEIDSALCGDGFKKLLEQNFDRIKDTATPVR